MYTSGLGSLCLAAEDGISLAGVPGGYRLRYPLVVTVVVATAAVGFEPAIAGSSGSPQPRWRAPTD